MGDEVYDTLRLRGTDIANLLDENKERDADGDSARSSKRWSMQQQKAIVTVLEEGGVRRNLAVVPRNLSSEGIGFFHGGFMHSGTKCFVTLRTMTGGAVPHKGKIVRCIHKKGRLHEIGVLFDTPISPRDYFIDVGDSPLFNSEAVDVSALTGTAMVVLESQAERKLIADHFKHSEMTIAEASNATQAIEMLADQDPDMIFADCALSDMAWSELVTSLRESGFVGPIVLLASEVDQNLRYTAITTGANEVIFKPLTASILHRAAAEYLLTTSSGSGVLQPMISTLDPTQVDRAVIQEYIDELQDNAVSLHHAIKEHDTETLKKVFLSIGSSAHGFGFAQLGDVAKEAVSVLENPSGDQMVKLRAYEVMKMCRRAEPPVDMGEFADDNDEKGDGAKSDAA